MSNTFDPHGTTILAVRRNGSVAIGGDGQVTLGQTVMKGNARKVRRLFGDKVLAGFAKDWRSDRYLRRLEALLLVGDKDKLFVISGNGDVIEPEFDVAAIGSGGSYALAAARALVESSELDARSI